MQVYKRRRKGGLIVMISLATVLALLPVIGERRREEEIQPAAVAMTAEYAARQNPEPEIDLSEYVGSGEVPLFLQGDERWGYDMYAGERMEKSGCGPVCLSMVCVYLLEDATYTPRYVAEFATENGYAVSGKGSAWSLIPEGGALLGLTVTELSLSESLIRDNLEAGNPVICVMGPGDFTTSGHFIVLTEYVDGKVRVNDPNSVERSEKLWELSEILTQIKNLWACSK